MKNIDLLAALTPVIGVLEELGVSYYIGGSVASSVHGVARTTLAVDVVCDLRAAHVARFVEALESAYYVDIGMIRDAVARRACFNVIHLESMIKVDLFVSKTRGFDRTAMQRKSREVLDDAEPSFAPFIASAEDTILSKIEWYRMGGGVSDRQWRDAVGVMQVRERNLDMAYLRDAAREIGIADLLRRAIDEAGTGQGGQPG